MSAGSEDFDHDQRCYGLGESEVLAMMTLNPLIMYLIDGQNAGSARIADKTFGPYKDMPWRLQRLLKTY